MKYRNCFISDLVRLEIKTNSRNVYDLINSIMDFSENPRDIKPKAKLDYKIEELYPENPIEGKDVLYSSRIMENGSVKRVLSAPIVTILTDRKKGSIDVKIIRYEDSIKAQILDNILMDPIRLVLAERGYFFQHAAVVSKGNTGVLISGPQMCGKSTLSFMLGRNGFGLLTDDDCYVKQSGEQVRIYPFPTKMGVSEHVLRKYPELNKHVLKGFLYGNKKRISLRHASDTHHTGNYRCGLILFPRYDPKRKRVHVKSVDKEDAVSRLCEDNNLTMSKKARIKSFWTVYSLVKGARTYQLYYNNDNLGKVAGVVEGLLESDNR